jgi:hypothetical protein
LPDPKIKKDLAQDERVLVEIDRAQFNELAEKGTLKSYRRAVETGYIKASGDSNVPPRSGCGWGLGCYYALSGIIAL